MIALKKKKTLTRTKKSGDKEKMCLLILNLCLLELLKKTLMSRALYFV